MLVASCLCAVLPARAQIDTLWTRTLGADGSEAASTIIKDGADFVIAGTRLFDPEDSFGKGDSYLVKVDAEGRLVWQQTYPATGLGVEMEDVVRTSDGGYLLVGERYTRSSEGFDHPSTAYYLKVKGDGEMAWEKTFQFGQFHNTGFSTVTRSTQGGFIAGGYIEGGRACCVGVVVAQLDEAGSVGWHAGENTIRGLVGSVLVSERQGGDVLLVARWRALLRLRAGGDFETIRNYREDAEYGAFSYAIQTTDTDYVVTSEADDRLVATRLDSAGTLLWQRPFDIAHDNNEKAPVVELIDGGFLIAVKASIGPDDLMVMKLDARGNTLFEQTFDIPGDEITVKAAVADGEQVVLVGETKRGEEMDIWLTKVGFSTATSIKQAPGDLPGTLLGKTYPNPFRTETVIPFHIGQPAYVTVTVYDLLGREITVLAEGFYGPGGYAVTWDGAGAGSGLYVCHLQAGTHAETKLLILQR